MTVSRSFKIKKKAILKLVVMCGCEICLMTKRDKVTLDMWERKFLGMKKIS
jgi:hypothetical protein